MNLGGGGGGGKEVNRRTDGGVPFWLLKWYPKIQFSHENPTQKFILQDFMLTISARKTMPH